MENIEILVPDHAKARVMRELGRLDATRFATVPSHRSAQRMVVTWLPDLDVVENRRELWTLSAAASRAPVIFIVGSGASGKTSLFGPAMFQDVIHWCRRARQEPYIAPTADAVRRMVRARQHGSEKELIASVSIDDGKLVVWSCEPRRFEVPVSEILALERMPADALGKFVLSESGSRISWPDADVDINLDTVREHADPEVRREHEARARQDAARYALAIRQLREERGLKQSDIEGLTDRQVRRLEQGDTVPQIDTLRRLASAHGMAIDDYLQELAKRSRTSRRRRTTRRSRHEARLR